MAGKELAEANKAKRKKLREIYTAFQNKHWNKRWILLSKINGLNDFEAHNNILRLHKSTSERLDHYLYIYGRILNSYTLHTQKNHNTPSKKNIPNKKYTTNNHPHLNILDLGMGLNSFSLPYLLLAARKSNLFKDSINFNSPKINLSYCGTELMHEDCDFVNLYFKNLKKSKIKGINGICFCADLSSQISIKEVCSKIKLWFTKSNEDINICFMLKLLDTIEDLKFNISKIILKEILSLNISLLVISFSTKTLGGRKKIHERGWFLKLLKEFSISIEDKFETKNEIFYIITPKN